MDDNLKKYSLLSQPGFLLSAKEKIRSGGTIITLIGGRVPTPVIEECFVRVGFVAQQIFIAFMRQSDPQFLKEYAAYEKAEGVPFSFYDYEKAATLLKEATGVLALDVLGNRKENEIRDTLREVEINAGERP